LEAYGSVSNGSSRIWVGMELGIPIACLRNSPSYSTQASMQYMYLRRKNASQKRQEIYVQALPTC